MTSISITPRAITAPLASSDTASAGARPTPAALPPVLGASWSHLAPASGAAPASAGAFYAALEPELQQRLFDDLGAYAASGGAAPITVEDKLVLMLGRLLALLDEDIEEQAGHIEALQAQGSRALGTGDGRTTPSARARGDGEQSVDLEMTKLKRMTDKREQFAAMYRGMLATYNETAKGATASIANG